MQIKTLNVDNLTRQQIRSKVLRTWEAETPPPQNPLEAGLAKSRTDQHSKIPEVQKSGSAEG
jgi:hypothetical protein